MKKLLLLCALLLAPLSSYAQNVRQTGTITPGHAAAWSANGVIRDAGTAASGNLTSVGVTNNGGPGICLNSAPITQPFNQLCLSVSTSAAASLSLQNYGGAAAQSLNIVVNGSPLNLPPSGGTNGQVLIAQT